MALSDTLINGINDPNCSFFVGSFTGVIGVLGIFFKLLQYALGFYLIYKISGLIYRIYLNYRIDRKLSEFHKLISTRYKIRRSK